ncbi:hypothetical protein [uncultured Polaribacter sp.]|nr:hypothetical protein [uncultured Polaribacter sp.]
MISINKLKNLLADKLFGEDYYNDCSEYEQYIIREELNKLFQKA